MRTSGVLMHISSLPSETGIGTLGVEAYRFVDFLKKSGQTYWQVLPLCPTSYGDSPYQSFSTFAGNPYFIDFELLRKDGLLKNSDYSKIDWGKNPEKIEFSKIYENRFNVLKIAYNNFDLTKKEYIEFCNINSYWLEDFGLYMALKNAFDGKPWNEWPIELKTRKSSAINKIKTELKNDIEFQKFIQYLFFCQKPSCIKHFLASSPMSTVLSPSNSSGLNTLHIFRYTSVWRRGKFRKTFSEFLTDATTRGTLALWAILKTPFLKGSIPSPLFLVPSG